MARKTAQKAAQRPQNAKPERYLVQGPSNTPFAVITAGSPEAAVEAWSKRFDRPANEATAKKIKNEPAPPAPANK